MKLRITLFILSCYFIFFAVTPPFMLNDEPDHFQYIYWLAQGKYPQMPQRSGVFAFDKQISNIFNIVEVASNDYNIPSFNKIKLAVSKQLPFATKKNDTPLTYQVHHPPLYFLSSLVFFVPASVLTKSIVLIYYATRITSFLYYIGAVYFAFLICRKLFKKEKTALYITAVFAINPVTLKMGIAVNPDIASVFISLGILFVFLRAVSSVRLRIKSLLLMFFLVAVSSLIKFQNIVFSGFSFVYFFLKGLWHKKQRKFFLFGLLSLVVSFLFLLPWLTYSFITYQSITPSYRAYTFFCTANLAPIPWYRIPFETVFELRHAFFHFAGFLGWGEPYPFKIFFVPYAVGFVLLILTGAWQAVRNREKQLLVVGLFVLCIILFFLGVSFTYKVNRYSCDIQGRYLLSALLPFFLFALRGLRSFVHMHEHKIAFYMFLFAATQYYFILFFVLIPRYYV